MTVAEVFGSVDLSPRGPKEWQVVPECDQPGVYVVARVGERAAHCQPCELPLQVPFPPDILIRSDYELKRWLRDEPVLYIGKADQSIRRRTAQFYTHQIGRRSPHAGGQVILLLSCEKWVYWSPCDQPREVEAKMLEAFKDRAGSYPLGNFDGKRGPKRVQRLL